MTTVLSQPLSLRRATATIGPVELADTASVAKVTVPLWTGTATLRLELELSFDGGQTWRQVCAAGPSPAHKDYRGRDEMWIRFDGLWRMCQCGEVYVPGHPANGRLLAHSDHKGREGRTIRTLDDVTFHSPTPASGLPRRQLRIVATSSANLSSLITVDVD